MSDDPQLEALARDLHAIRAEPEPEFARELDRRAAGWIREGERRGRWRLPSLRIAAPALAAVAAAAVALVIVAGGDDGNPGSELAVTVVPAQQQEGGGAEALTAPSQRDSAADAEQGTFTSPTAAAAGEPLVATYFAPRDARARVRLDGRETQVQVPAGAGRLEISTDGLEPGIHELEVEIPPIPAQRTQVEITPPR